jgi:hypothetical protein
MDGAITPLSVNDFMAWTGINKPVNVFFNLAKF